MICTDTQDEQGRYQIRVRGRIDTQWSGWFENLTISVEARTGITILEGRLADQAALRGILNKLWDLNLTLISVTRTDNRFTERETKSGG